MPRGLEARTSRSQIEYVSSACLGTSPEATGLGEGPPLRNAAREVREMWRLLAAAGGLMLLLAVAVCDAGATPPSEGPGLVENRRCVTAESGDEFCDETAEGGFDQATAYETARDACGVFGVREIAREYGTGDDPVSAAKGYAEDKRGRTGWAALLGCLDGFRDRVIRV